MKNTILLFLIFFFVSCNQQEIDIAQSIIDKAIDAHGGENYNSLDIEFDFRKYHYSVNHNKGNYIYTRTYEDSIFIVKETLDNNSVKQWIDGVESTLSEKDSGRIGSSINSQVYFALLPYRLNDQAVIKEYIGEKMIKEEPYHKIKVTFSKEGGGEDFDDEFIYWIHKDNYTMDYLAYEFHVNKGGFRFREAYNVRNIGGIRYADFVNYKETDTTTLIVDYDLLFENNGLKELSKIELKNIKALNKND